jgi:putative hydrolase of the HAD superfamily
LADRFGLEVSESEASRALGAEISYYRAHLDEGGDQPGLADLRRRCALELRAALPRSETLDAVGVSELVAALLASLRFRAFPDAAPAIAAARRAGWRVVVASNWDVSLHDVLARLGLAALLDGIVTSAEVGARKPAAAVFECALALVGAGAAEAVHVGDSLAEDVVGARRAGLEAVLIARSVDDGVAAPPEGVRVIATLAELEPLLARPRST